MKKNVSDFFVLEGLDGSGKTTIMKRLGWEVPDFVYTREPGGSEFGEKIREVLLHPRSKNVPALAHLLGFMSARASHFKELIVPSLKKGMVVISDRFDASTFAFQLFGQQNQKLEELFWYLREEIIRNGKDLSYHPNYIYLRISPDVAATRRMIRQNSEGKETHFDLQKNDYHQRVFLGYEKFFDEIGRLAACPTNPSENVVRIVDASMAPDAVYDAVKEIIMNPSSLRR